MIVKRNIPRGTVLINLNDRPATCEVDGIEFEETDHGWVECPLDDDIWWESVQRKAKKVKYDGKPRHAWNGFCNPDVRRKVKEKEITYRFPLPGKEQTAAIHRKRKEEEIRKRKEEIRKRKEETSKSKTESVQCSLEQSPYALGRLPNQKRKYGPESDEADWNQKRRHRDASRKEIYDNTKTEKVTKTSLRQLYELAYSKCLV